MCRLNTFCSLVADMQAIFCKGHRGHGVPCDSLSCEDTKLQLHLGSIKGIFFLRVTLNMGRINRRDRILAVG